MEEEVSDHQQSAEVTPASSENDLLENKSEDSIDDDDDDDEDDDDIDKMLSELQTFQEELEQKSQFPTEDEQSPGISPFVPPSQPLDQFRFSISAIEGSGEVDLDALLEDLCVMERDMTSPIETDSMFSETISSPIINSPISPKMKVSADVRSRLESVQEETRELTPEEQHERIKAEKIRIALEKLRAARVKKLVVKVYNDEDPTSKTVAIDQTWTAWEVCKKMMRKNDTEPDPNWVLIERIPELFLERLLEDHESVVDVVSTWPWDSENKLVINNRREKYALFRNPQNFLLTSDTSAGAAQLAEKSKDILLQEFFQKDAMRLPELDGILYLKEGKKSWKKHYFVLRASGIYYTPKGKTKSSRDIVCLMKFEHVSIYNGIGFKKKLKAPTEHCFVLKHPQYHDLESKAVRCFCAEDLKTMQRWMVGIRLAKFGYKMLVDYTDTQDEMDKLAFTLDRNKFTRSSSFTAGQTSDQIDGKLESQAEPPKDYQSMKAKVQSQRIKDSIGTSSIHPSGSMSFSVNRSKIEPKKPSKKIGNLFSDAWKKGNEYDSKNISEPISPDPPSTHSAGAATPNTLDPKPFTIDNVSLQPLEEEHEVKDETHETEAGEAVVPEHNLVLDPPPLPRKSFSKKIEGEPAQPQGDNSEDREQAQNGGELSPRGRSSFKQPRRTRSVSPPPPPPSPPLANRGVTQEPSNNMGVSHSSNTRGSASPPPPPVPPKSATPRTSSVSSENSVFRRTSSSASDHEVFPQTPSIVSDQSGMPQPAPSTSDQEVFSGSLLPPPSRLLSTSMEEMPPPPPTSDVQEDADVELPPPPPEVLFKERLSMSISNGRRRTPSDAPAVPPKTGRPRYSSSGPQSPTSQGRTSSFTGSS